jgi:hypothetical protein
MPYSDKLSKDRATLTNFLGIASVKSERKMGGQAEGGFQIDDFSLGRADLRGFS